MSAPGTAQNESSEQASSRPGLPGVRILIAEDIAVNAEIILAILEGTGATGAVAQNGRAAVDMFAADPTYDLILMDLQMPVMDGFAATRAIRALAHPAALRVPVIAVSANVFKDDIRACMDAGMNDHIPKPVDEALFFSTVSKYVTVTAPKAAKTAATGGAYDAYLPDINVADGLKRLCGNKKLYAKLLTHFRDYIGLNGLNAALAAENLSAAKDAAHTIKGTAANLSLVACYQAAADLNAALAAGAADPAAVAALAHAHARTLTLIEKLLPELA